MSVFKINAFHFRMAEPRFNNPYFWPPPPSMPGQVSPLVTCNYGVTFTFNCHLFPCVNVFSAIQHQTNSQRICHSLFLHIKIYIYIKKGSRSVCWLVFSVLGCVFWGVNDIHTRWLFSVEHDPLTLSAG